MTDEQILNAAYTARVVIGRRFGQHGPHQEDFGAIADLAAVKVAQTFHGTDTQYRTAAIHRAVWDVIDFLRRELGRTVDKRTVPLLVDDELNVYASVEDHAPWVIDLVDVKRALGRVPAHHRRILLRLAAGWPLSEAAAAEGLSEARACQIRKRFVRAAKDVSRRPTVAVADCPSQVERETLGSGGRRLTSPAPPNRVEDSCPASVADPVT